MVSAQETDIDGRLGKADSLRKAYDFEKSVEVYDGILSEISDSLLRIEVEDLKILSENGAGMTDYVSTPEVVAKHFFSADEFFLFYPLPDKSWRTLPEMNNYAFLKVKNIDIRNCQNRNRQPSRAWRVIMKNSFHVRNYIRLIRIFTRSRLKKSFLESFFRL